MWHHLCINVSLLLSYHCDVSSPGAERWKSMEAWWQAVSSHEKCRQKGRRRRRKKREHEWERERENKHSVVQIAILLLILLLTFVMMSDVTNVFVRKHVIDMNIFKKHYYLCFALYWKNTNRHNNYMLNWINMHDCVANQSWKL